MARFEWDEGTQTYWDLGPLGGAQGPKLINPKFKGMKLPPKPKKLSAAEKDAQRWAKEKAKAGIKE
jgi:hypothetical protein